jgi:hypothetical protein
MVAVSDRGAVIFSLSSGEAGDAPQGRVLLTFPGRVSKETFLLMDRAYEGDETRVLALSLGFLPSSHQKTTERTLGGTTKNFTKCVIR